MGSSWFSRRRQSKASPSAFHFSHSLPIRKDAAAASVSNDRQQQYHSVPPVSFLPLPPIDEPERRRPLSTWELEFEQIFDDTERERHVLDLYARAPSMSTSALVTSTGSLWQTSGASDAAPPTFRAPAFPETNRERKVRKHRRILSGFRPEVSKRGSSLISQSMLQGDFAMDNTPSLSSASSTSGDAADDATCSRSSGEQPSRRLSNLWGLKGSSSRTELTIDMVKVHDGLSIRESSSGVYTPTTFPGPSGPRRSHCPSNVYAPPGSNLYPQPPTPSPRQSPVSPYRENSSPQQGGRFAASFVGKAQVAMSSWKRSASREPETPVTPSTPHCTSDSYFAYPSSPPYSPASPEAGFGGYRAGRFAESQPALGHYKSSSDVFAPAANMSSPVRDGAQVSALGLQYAVPERASLAQASKGVRRKAVPKLVKDEVDL